MHSGHSGKFVTRERFIPVPKITETLGRELCSMLPAAHALTGCDTTSGLFKLGKRTVSAMLKKNTKIL